MKKIILACGTCQTQHTVDMKNFSGGMARTLIALCRRYQQTNGWMDAKAMGLSPSDLEKLAFWGYAEQQAPEGRRKKSGIWRPTQNGWNFSQGGLSGTKSLLVENGVVTGMISEKLVTVHDIIKQEDFNRCWAA